MQAEFRVTGRYSPDLAVKIQGTIWCICRTETGFKLVEAFDRGIKWEEAEEVEELFDNTHGVSLEYNVGLIDEHWSSDHLREALPRVAEIFDLPPISGREIRTTWRYIGVGDKVKQLQLRRQGKEIEIVFARNSGGDLYLMSEMWIDNCNRLVFPLQKIIVQIARWENLIATVARRDRWPVSQKRGRYSGFKGWWEINFPEIGAPTIIQREGYNTRDYR
jgi:hypothetical protein